jgi:4-hydroxy-3-methylbut-2-en-1-yl diphosphate synthase IspG/GcpE
VSLSICDEHGGDIAYAGVECPACAQLEVTIEKMSTAHNEELEDLSFQLDEALGELQDLKIKYMENDSGH